jgi:D-sedoheptulose 7-phosphate isomerase
MPGPSDNFSRAFYPFLHSDDRLPGQLTDELRFSLLEKARESMEVKGRFFEENKDTILEASLQMARAFQRGRKMLTCGNGGSATDAQHIAVEFMHPITVGRRALPVICLSNDLAMVTAVANDVGFDDVFARQVIALGREGDVLLGVSTSGNSANLIHAFETARRMKLLSIAFTGGDGGRMLQMKSVGNLEFCLTVPTSSIHRIQETHVTLYHAMWDLVHEFLQHKSVVGAADSEEGLNREVEDEIHR